jgi:hypothetical protein
MIDLDRISNLDWVNEYAEAIARRHPLPAEPRLSEMPTKDANAFLHELHELIDEYLGVMGALRRPGRAWVDVRLASGRWVGQSIDDCPTEAALSCAYWHSERVIAAGIGLRDSTAAAEARQARIDSGDLLAVLGGEW